MPDMKDAFKKAGLQPSQPPERPTSPPPPIRQPSAAGQSKYPQYFNSDGDLRVEMVRNEAETLADTFVRDNLRRHQLRAFFDHAKRQLLRLNSGCRFGEIHPEVAKLRAIAADRAGRSSNALPPSFKNFIFTNVDAVIDKKTFQKGFMPHFEAVVAYCTPQIKE